jgi:hypothetical protein
MGNETDHIAEAEKRRQPLLARLAASPVLRLRMFKQLYDELRQAVKNFPVERLDEPLIPGPTYTAHTRFKGVTRHNLYHAGQIALLKKWLRHTEDDRCDSLS